MKPRITAAQLVLDSRRALGETQEIFAKRFKVHANTVSRWETGTYDVPSFIILRLLMDESKPLKCPRCKGKGTI